MAGLAQLINLQWPEALTYMLVLGRTSGLVVSAPFWGSRVVPGLVRGWVAVVLSAAVYPFVQTVSFPAGAAAATESAAIIVLVLALVGEVLLGIALGWAAQLLFAGLRLAAQQLEMKMGLSIAQIVDPQWGEHSSSLSVFFELVGVLIFFSLNGHRLFIQALTLSYAVFPLAGEKLALGRMIVGSAGDIFSIALRVAAPVVVGLLLSDIVLGIISRAIPQMNVFFVAMPLQLAFGMLLLFISLPAVVWFCADYLGAVSNQLSALR